MAFRSTQPMTKMNTRSFPGSKGRPACKADNLTAICEPTDKKVWELQRLTNLWAYSSCYSDSSAFFTFDFKTTNERHILTVKCETVYSLQNLREEVFLIMFRER
jgi:hypothetical protein